MQIKIDCVKQVEGAEETKVFNSDLVYDNLGYEDVVLLEKALIGALSGLAKHAEEVKIPEKKAKKEKEKRDK